MRCFRFILAVVFSSIVPSAMAGAQASPTAARAANFSVFAAANGTWIGLDGGRNLGVTAGVDLDLPGFGRFRPAVEVRGTYPVNSGGVAGERNILGGIELDYHSGRRVVPYAFALFGRGRIDYAYPGLQKPGTVAFYNITSSNVVSGGTGMKFVMSPTFSLRGEVQFNYQPVPVTPSGTITASAVNIGLDWRPRFRRRRGTSDAD